MMPLEWTKRPGGWQSGPYDIELLAPGIWILSSRAQASRPTERHSFGRIESTDSSLRALQAKARQVERRRIRRRRVKQRAAVLLLALLVLGFSSISLPGWAPLAIVVSSTVALFVLLSIIDLLAGRPWESIKDNRQ